MSAGDTDYEKAKQIAAAGGLAERRRVAEQTDTKPELLYYLANDKSAEVRRAIAGNTSTPRQADVLLSKDADVAVRSGLAAKISALVPGMSPERVSQVEQLALDLLEQLARDQAVEVRAVIAETLKDVPGAPPAVIQALARDLEESVSLPVLRHSPVLTEEDLLAIIAGQPMDSALIAIAGRAGVQTAVSDALAATGSETVVASLLANHSAQIREETLDRLIELAPQHEPWHGPLVRRPVLSPKAAERLAGFVAGTLVDVLRNRADLPAATRDAVARTMQQRLGGKGAAIAEPAAAEAREKDRPLDRAKQLLKEGKLHVDALEDALDAGDRGLVVAGLALLAKVPMDLVNRVLSGQSARGVTALVWKAGLSPGFAKRAQLRLAHIPPASVLNPRGDKFPMTDAEMKWQLEFFGA